VSLVATGFFFIHTLFLLFGVVMHNYYLAETVDT